MKKFRVGFFGDGPWSHRALDALLADPSLEVAFVCARYDNPDAVLRERSGRAGVEFVTDPNVNGDDFLALVDRQQCDLFVSMSFNQIFRARLMRRPRLQTINCHAGKLPFYRGRNILNWALINDEKEFGITVHQVDEGVDTGDILAQRTYPITDDDDLSTLLDRAHVECATLLYATVKQLQAGSVKRTPQASIHPTGFYCTRRTDGDERLNWDQPSRAVFNFVRALCRPGPVARTFRGSTELCVNRVRLVPEAPSYKGIAGAVLGVEEGGFLVKTADSFVKVVDWSGGDSVRVGDRLT